VSEQGPSRPLTDLGGIIVLRRCLLACALLLVVPAVASGHDPRQERPSRWIGTAGTNVPLVMSPNVRLVDTFPETQGISGEFARTGDFFYMSSLDSVSVFDTSDPLHPKLRGTLANLVFENEAMSYGERLRFIDTRNARDLKQFAYVTGGGTEVWDAYWVPQRDKRGVAQRKKTNIVYTTDLVRGLDVY
jgi:hypothetical protein